ncbi:MAG: YihY/virulence factor BrkB family protein [Anaerofustis sp.]
MKREDMKELGKRMVKVIFSDEIYASASQLAYSMILAIIPLIMFTITLAGKLTLPVDDIYSYLSYILPQQAFSTIQKILDEIASSANFSLVTLIPTIYFISIGTRGLMKVTNKAYHTIENRPVLEFWVLSFLFAVLLGVMFLVTLAAVVFGRVIMNSVNALFNDLFALNFIQILLVMRYLVTFFLIGMVFCSIYAAAPNLKLRIRDVYWGGYVAAFLWILGSSLFGYYVNNFSNYGLLFGSLGGIFILLGWLYWTSLILLLGSYLNASIYYLKRKKKTE